MSAPIFYEISQEQKKPEFKEKYKKRSSIEWKNAELKHLHGMARARGWGKRSVTFQIKLTAIAVNLKRIAAIMAKPDAETGCNALPVDAFIAACNGILNFLPVFLLKRDYLPAV